MKTLSTKSSVSASFRSIYHSLSIDCFFCSRKSVLMIALLLFPSISTVGQEPLINRVVDFVGERDSLEWVNLNEQAVPLDGPEANREVVKMREVTINSGDDKIGDIDADALYIQAKPGRAGDDFGILGRKIVRLPEKQFIQFQAGLSLLDGRREGLAIYLQVETRGDSHSPWMVAETYSPVVNTQADAGRDSAYFKTDLSRWSGEEVRLSIGAKVKPAYTKIMGIEQYQPEKISVEWYLAEVVASRFRVIIGEPEKISLNPEPVIKAKTLNPIKAGMVISTTVMSSTSTPELILEGASGSPGQLHNPSDAEITTHALPADNYFSGRFVCYFTSRLNDGYEPHGQGHTQYSPPGVYGASTRMIDFATSTSTNMYNGSATDIRNCMRVLNCTATAVLFPSGDVSRNFDDHYTAIISVADDTLSNGNKVLHAFYYAEDHFTDSDATPTHNLGKQVYSRIGYARSYANSNFGRSFTKIADSSAYATITDASCWWEDNIKSIMGDKTYGVGGCSIYPSGDYYYLIYHTWTPRRDIYGQFVLDPSGKLNQPPILCAARALKSELNRSSYSSYANPWKKFKHVTATKTDASNFAQPGNGGDYSGIWNITTVASLLTNKIDIPLRWRAYPKISYNSYLDANWPNHQGLMIVKGGLNSAQSAFWLHTSSNLLDWDDGLMVMESNKNEYPTLVGSNGYDGYTTQVNKLYYFNDRSNYGDLYRLPLTLQVQ